MITFKVFLVSSGCTGTPLATSSATVTANGNYFSMPFTPTATGTYVFVVTYSGDSNNNGVGPTSCTDTSEQFTVSKAGPTMTTSVAPSTITIGGSASDTATLSGGFSPTGTLTFKVYGPNDSTCSGAAVTVGSKTVSGNSPPNYVSPPFTPTAVGTYRWVVTYSGDSNNAGFTTSCNASGETLQVNGIIKIVKNTLGGDSTFSFATTGGGNFPASFSITTSGGTGMQTYTNIDPTKTYSVSENVPAGWKLESSSCTNGTPSSFTIPSSGTVTCTFKDSKRGTIQIIKNTIGGDATFGYSTTGGDNFPATFTITTSGGTGSQTFTNIDPDNTYSVAETVKPAGWTLGSASCSSGSPSAFTVAPGATVTCTFVNSKTTSSVTDTTFCNFGNQFRIVLVTNSTGTYKLVSTNPGGIYDNVFFTGTPGTPVSLSITIPYPFVTVGSFPIQVFSNVGTTTVGSIPGCFVPLNGITSSYTISAPGPLSSSGQPTIILSNYVPQNMGSTVTITVVGKIPSSGLIYVAIHLDYGLKDSLWSKSGSSAVGVTYPTVTILNNQPYTFTFSNFGTLISTTTITSVNHFNKDPGIAGIVQNAASGEPLVGVTVRLYDSNGNLIGTTTTDSDGFYAFSLTTKGTFTITVTLPRGSTVSQTIAVQQKIIYWLPFYV